MNQNCWKRFRNSQVDIPAPTIVTIFLKPPLFQRLINPLKSTVSSTYGVWLPSENKIFNYFERSFTLAGPLSTVSELPSKLNFCSKNLVIFSTGSIADVDCSFASSFGSSFASSFDSSFALSFDSSFDSSLETFSIDPFPQSSPISRRIF